MRFLKLGLAAAAAFCALSATAQADCVKVGAVGEAVTHDIAFLFATHGLANVIYGQGLASGTGIPMRCWSRTRALSGKAQRMAVFQLLPLRSPVRSGAVSASLGC